MRTPTAQKKQAVGRAAALLRRGPVAPRDVDGSPVGEANRIVADERGATAVSDEPLFAPDWCRLRQPLVLALHAGS